MLPRWYVSHWWGEPINDFVRSLQQHCEDRELDEDLSAYWVWAYAINHWDTAADVGINPLENAFVRAMELSDGILSVIDKGAVSYTRLWCSFEAWVALVMLPNKEDYQHDIYTALDKPVTITYGSGVPMREDRTVSAVGITSEVVAIDMERTTRSSPSRKKSTVSSTSQKSSSKGGQFDIVHKADKLARERLFPLKIGQSALNLRLFDAKVTEETDRRRILNGIIGETCYEELGVEPPAGHAKFKQLEHILRGRFAASMYRVALEAGEDMSDYQREFQASQLESVDMTFADCKKMNSGMSADLMKALPMTTLSLLSLEMGGNPQRPEIIKDNGIEALAVGLTSAPQIQELTLNFSYQTGVGDTGAKALATSISALPTLRKARLTFYDTNVGERGGEALTSVALAPELRSLELNLSKCAKVSDWTGKGLATSLASAAHLEALVLYVGETEFSNQGAEALADSLATARSLRNLVVYWPRAKVGKQGADALAAAIQSAPQLETVQATGSEKLLAACRELSEKASAQLSELSEKASAQLSDTSQRNAI